MNEPIRVGIGGLGRSGFAIHSEYLKDDPRFRVVAAADLLPERRRDAVERFGCRVYGNYAEMLEAGGFDLFVNATPSRLHVEASLAGLAAGFHVLSEKPSATAAAEFGRIVAAAKAAGREFFPFQNSRYYPHFRKIREVIASGALGEIVCIRSNWSSFARRWDWQTLQCECGGNLWNTGPHPVDQAVVLFGDAEPRVFCRMASHHFDFGGDAENFCALTLYGEGSPTIEIQISSFLAYPQGEQYNIQGTCGGLSGGPEGLRWKYFDPARAPKHGLWRPWSLDRQYCSEKLEWQEECWKLAETPSGAEFFRIMSGGVYSNLHDVLRSGAEREITLEQVRRQIQIMEEAHRQNPLPRRNTGGEQ
ncbi:MAG: Gfo/Idh/MocA family oxidoreductase [Lentisphaeria bacterium]|nr:Gfo/Idh/MocA family oxidoreductase [Lentisphaeria bacterium]